MADVASTLIAAGGVAILIGLIGWGLYLVADRLSLSSFSTDGTWWPWMKCRYLVFPGAACLLVGAVLGALA